MKIRSMVIRGFRGFNEERTIDFHDRLTLIFAPNSYGKTSISEAFEWLLYGVTSKVDKAESKDEYKGSYRNRHLAKSSIPSVRVNFAEGDKEVVFAGELAEDESLVRFVGEGESRVEVQDWPIGQDLNDVPRPFVLQHALKYLLLVKPDDRFQGFARLLGFEELDEIHRNIISLCTAPERKIPPEVTELQKHVTALQARLASRPSLVVVQKAFKKKGNTPKEIYDAILAESQNRVPAGTEEQSVLPQLLKIREDTVGKVFTGRITLSGLSSAEKLDNAEDQKFLVGCLADPFISEYTELVALANVEQVLKLAQFLGIGVDVLKQTPSKCPLCGRKMGETLVKHVHAEHARLVEQTKASESLKKQRLKVKETQENIRRRLKACHDRNVTKARSLLDLEPLLPPLRTILVPKHDVHFRRVESAVSGVSAAKNKIDQSYSAVIQVLDKVAESIEKSNEDSQLIRALGETLIRYCAGIGEYADVLSQQVSGISEADQILQHELDVRAGTEDVSLLINLIDSRSEIEKVYEIEGILNGLRELRKTADEYVANRMLEAVSGELTAEVMQWYNQIRTTGDPDVHFDGFDMERTQKGEVRARRVQIRAKSYGQDLVSAVSSLSESKLNALGLCVSIATNLKAQSPFDFLIIDDPIQSLDAEHETQFIQVIRSLVENSGKQVILLSHNRRWLDQVAARCRELNGLYYEITGYTQSGPHISDVSWEKWRDRLNLVNAILEDPNAGSIKLQQAEEEIRIVVAQLASELYYKRKGIHVSPHKLNSSEVERILTECGVETSFVNQIVQTYGTTDDSHHAPVGYTPERERIRRYHSWCHELARLLN